MKYLVTGGAGFIGSNLVDALLENPENRVTVVDDFSLGSRKNLANYVENSWLSVAEQGICANLSDVFDDTPDAVFHIAALPRVQYSIKYPKETREVNAGGTLNLLRQCVKSKVKRFVFASSSSVYGDQDVLPLHEGMRPNPMSPYAAQKFLSEKLCARFHREYGLETVALRFFNVYGPRQNPDGGYACLIPKTIARALRGEPPEIYGDGTHSRDFTCVDDVCRAIMCAGRTQNPAAFGNAFNIGAGEERTVNEVVSTIIRACDAGISPKYLPEVHEPARTRADISKTRAFLGWTPEVLFEDGIAQTVRYFAKEHEMQARK